MGSIKEILSLTGANARANDFEYRLMFLPGFGKDCTNVELNIGGISAVPGYGGDVKRVSVTRSARL
jgi:hypothetical protein